MPAAGTGGEVLVALDRGAGDLRGQLERGLRAAVRGGRLRAGERMPGSRTLAGDLGVSRRLVVEAYGQLAAEGWLAARPGGGTYVAVSERPGRASAPAPAARAPRLDFFPGAPDLAAFPRAAWLRALREVLRTTPDAALGYPDARGVPELRTELAAWLGRTRGVEAGPDDVVVCAGATQALALLARALGPGPVAVEDPSLPVLRAVLADRGAELVPLAVDGEGLDVDALQHGPARAVMATPAHQFPLGVPLAPARRAALAAWARDGRLVIEDDYSAEFRYDRPAVSALQAQAPGGVAYVGSASKALAPGLRLGWLVLPPALAGEAAAAKLLADLGTPVLEQLAFARLLARGEVDRHLRALRRRYRVRRATLAGALADHLPEAEMLGVPGGVHVTVALPQPVDGAALVREARARDVGVAPLSWFRVGDPPATDAVVLGYGNLAEPAVREGVRRLAEACVAVA